MSRAYLIGAFQSCSLTMNERFGKRNGPNRRALQANFMNQPVQSFDPRARCASHGNDGRDWFSRRLPFQPAVSLPRRTP